VEVTEIVAEEAAPAAVEQEVIDVQVEEENVETTVPSERAVTGSDIITEPVADVEVAEIVVEDTKEQGIISCSMRRII
jgi:uncharacterized protein (UPF0179 family)